MSNRIEEEIATIERMIRIYCHDKEGNNELCKECEELLSYSKKRLRSCPFKEKKTTCRLCSVHCYKAEMKAKIQVIMRYSGPRMIIYHPICAVKHLFREYNDKKNSKK